MLDEPSSALATPGGDATGATAARARAAWSTDAVEALYSLPFADLLFRAQQVHRAHHAADAVQLSTLLSIKTGGCPEDCGYCPQAARYHTGVASEAMLSLEAVLGAARAAKDAGATRFCMGAAWRGPKDRDLAPVLDMVRGVKALGLEACCTLGMLKDGQAEQLRDAGLKVCCGGIVGMGESREGRAGLLAQLASLVPQPESVPINELVQVEGTPLAGTGKLPWMEFVRTIAVARILMPRSVV
ncbi:MAG TPA: biotin synthase BioB, partial [Casimicrobiaceae bacterium]|nr:biotin synthase BioB [Casimicrobiaceae bacterium]